MAQLLHPNVVQVFDTGSIGTRLYVAMELVEGTTLRDWVRQGRSVAEIVRVCVMAGRGLAAAHRVGIVHRDIKPCNVLIRDDGDALVSDFGLAAEPVRTNTATGGSTTHSRSGAGPRKRKEAAASRTLTGAVLGTPRYMAPEQAAGRVLDPRADQYSWCLVLLEALQGGLPGDQAKTVAASRPAPGVPDALMTVLRRGLAVHPEDRHPTMDALLQAVERAIRPRLRRRLVEAGALVAVTGLGLAYWQHADARNVATCESADGKFERTFDDAAATQIGLAMAASGRPHAQDTFARVASRLDAYAGRWKQQRSEACRAVTREEPWADERLRCVDAALEQASELVRLLRDGTDPVTTDHAVVAVSALPEPAACEGPPTAPPPLPPQVDLVAEIESRLATARALRWTGRPRPALAEAHAAVDAAQLLSHAPTRAAAWLTVGELQADTDDLEEAEHSLWKAIDEASTTAPLVSARAWTVMVELVARGGGDLERGLALADIAEAEARRAGDELLGARLMLVRAQVYGATGRHARAVEEATRALGIARRRYGPDDPRLVRVHRRVADAFERAGQTVEARRHLESAVALGERTMGRRHPHVVALRDQLHAGLDSLSGAAPGGASPSRTAHP